MVIDLFLWPMVIPMILPLLYCVFYKKRALIETSIITVTMIFMVILYWPMLSSNVFSVYTYPVVKVLLFVFLPLFMLLLFSRSSSVFKFSQYGVQKEGLKKSMWWCCLFLPVMIVVTGSIFYVQGLGGDGDFFGGMLSFFEAFTEEFFFRGILFVYLLQKTHASIAYVTSYTSFLLMHPQQLATPFIIITLIQGLLTLEIARRSHNIIGSWVLHGVNRFFSIALFPFLF